MVARLTISMVAALAPLGLGLNAAQAADYSPPPVYVQPPPVQEFADGWYLRGDIGFTNQQLRDLTNVQDANNSVTNVGLGFDSSALFGLGVGYYVNDWLRLDVTGEYRSRANFHGSQVIKSGGATYTDEYSASKSEWLFLLNAYVDLGTWSGFTPFVGAGVGTSYNTIHSFQDVNTPNGGVAFGDTASKWNFAWALHAGVGYRVSRNVTLELAYRYVNLGNAESGDIYDYVGTNNVYNPMQFNQLTSHDIKFGMRVNFDAFGGDYRPAPYYTPAPVYAPAPVYQPAPEYPPLRSRG